MKLLSCGIAVDPSGRELIEHGTAAFPIACYHDPLALAEVPWHWHEELEAGIIIRDPTVVTVGQEKYTLFPGQGFFINSGVLHGAYAPEEKDSLIHSLVFHARLVSGSTDSIFHQQYLRPLLRNPQLESFVLTPDIPWQREALDAIQSAWEACSREEPGYEFSVRSALSRLVWLLYSNQPRQGHAPNSKALRDAERIKQLLSFIHDHYGSELTMEVIAASAAISESECLRCFRSTIGVSPIQYLKQYRLRQAASRLLSTEDRICDIAAHCGFQDMSYFSKAFREWKGCTPTQYRLSKKSQP